MGVDLLSDLMLQLPCSTVVSAVPGIDNIVEELFDDFDNEKSKKTSTEIAIDYFKSIYENLSTSPPTRLIVDETRFNSYIRSRGKSPTTVLKILSGRAENLGLDLSMNTLEAYGINWIILPKKEELDLLSKRIRMKSEQVSEYLEVPLGVLGSEKLDEFYETGIDEKTLEVMLEVPISQWDKKDYVGAMFKLIQEQKFGDKVLVDKTRIIQYIMNLSEISYASALNWINKFTEVAKIKKHRQGNRTWYLINKDVNIENALDKMSSNRKNISPEPNYLSVRLGQLGSKELDIFYELGINRDNLESYLDNSVEESTNPDCIYAIFKLLQEEDFGDNVLIDKTRIIKTLTRLELMSYPVAAKWIDDFVNAAGIETHRHGNRSWYLFKKSICLDEALNDMKPKKTRVSSLKSKYSIVDLGQLGSEKLDKFYSNMDIKKLDKYVDVPEDEKKSIDYVYAFFKLISEQNLDTKVLVDRTRIIKQLKDNKLLSYPVAARWIDDFVNFAGIETYKLGNRSWYLLGNADLDSTYIKIKGKSSKKSSKKIKPVAKKVIPEVKNNDKSHKISAERRKQLYREVKKSQKREKIEESLGELVQGGLPFTKRQGFMFGNIDVSDASRIINSKVEEGEIRASEFIVVLQENRGAKYCQIYSGPNLDIPMSPDLYLTMMVNLATSGRIFNLDELNQAFNGINGAQLDNLVYFMQDKKIGHGKLIRGNFLLRYAGEDFELLKGQQRELSEILKDKVAKSEKIYRQGLEALRNVRPIYNIGHILEVIENPLLPISQTPFTYVNKKPIIGQKVNEEELKLMLDQMQHFGLIKIDSEEILMAPISDAFAYIKD